MWAISVFGNSLVQHQHHHLSGCKLYFPQIFTFFIFFVLLSCLMNLFYTHFIVLFFLIFSIKIFLLYTFDQSCFFCVLANVYTSGVVNAAFLSCSIMSSKIHHVQKDSFWSVIAQKYSIIPTDAFSLLTDYQGRSNLLSMKAQNYRVLWVEKEL